MVSATIVVLTASVTILSVAQPIMLRAAYAVEILMEGLKVITFLRMLLHLRNRVCCPQADQSKRSLCQEHTLNFFRSGEFPHKIFNLEVLIVPVEFRIWSDISISVFFCRAGCDSDWLSGLFPQVNLILKSYQKKLEASRKIVSSCVTNTKNISYHIKSHRHNNES